MTAAWPQPSPDAALTPALSSAFTPEFDLLLGCCAESVDECRQTEPPQNLDWGRFAQLAQRHGVVPLVYPRLAGMGPRLTRSLPDLRALYEANARQGLWLTKELFRILDRLKQSGITALPYKGPVLAAMLYGNVTMRQFVDLDLLIHPADLPRVRPALAELGYKPALSLTPREERAYLRSGYEYAFDGPRGANLLEIKWQILPRFYCVNFDFRDLFERAIVETLGSGAVRTLSHEDLLLVLCVHAAKHAWMQLSWLCDIASLARSKPLNWTVIGQRARQLRIQRIVAVTFLLAHRLLAAPLPQTVQQISQDDPAAEVVAQKALSILADANEYDIEAPSYFRLMTQAREHWQDRLRFLWRLASTPGVGEWSAIRLPGLFFPLYRVVRLARLAKRWL